MAHEFKQHHVDCEERLLELRLTCDSLQDKIQRSEKLERQLEKLMHQEDDLPQLLPSQDDTADSTAFDRMF